MWNVKIVEPNQAVAIRNDLIDTLWNVKSTEYTVPQIAVADLIDTLWNVKANLFAQLENYPVGFNRYIVECKG